MRRYSEKPSFEVHTCMREKICIWCGNIIPKGQKYYSKPENNEMVARSLEEKTGYDIRTIKARTRFYFCDRISWPFCSSECMSEFSRWTWKTLPFNVRGRMGIKITSIVEKIQDVIALMTNLEGSRGKDHERSK